MRLRLSNSLAKIILKMRESPGNVRYNELVSVCTHYFGQPRQDSTSHSVYRTPWRDDPRVNIQLGQNGKVKPYQIKQVLAAIDKLRGGRE
ncbi:MAG: toxin HicA [Candidatus Adiutrix sp.]|nr:toxin HicA [Candidatus Adiutrix sp.]